MRTALVDAKAGALAGALLDPVDPPSPELLDEGQISSSVLRVCHYRAGGDGDAENGAGAGRGGGCREDG